MASNYNPGILRESFVMKFNLSKSNQASAAESRLFLVNKVNTMAADASDLFLVIVYIE